MPRDDLEKLVIVVVAGLFAALAFNAIELGTVVAQGEQLELSPNNVGAQAGGYAVAQVAAILLDAEGNPITGKG